MAKDPAFLFYSKDFYEGTRMMLPEERACYIDLLIYQHQNGFIPNDIKRMAMYCSGISEAILIATLEAKFKLCDKGYFNEKLKIVTDERNIFSERQSINGSIGQFWKKAKSFLSAKEYVKFKEAFKNQSNTELLESVKDKEINKAMLIAMLEAKLKHLAIANEDEDNNGINKKNIPEYLEFLEYAKTLEIYKPELEYSIKAKYQSWVENGWKDGNNKLISNWKTKLGNTIIYLKPIAPQREQPIISYNKIKAPETNG